MLISGQQSVNGWVCVNVAQTLTAHMVSLNVALRAMNFVELPKMTKW